MQSINSGDEVMENDDLMIELLMNDKALVIPKGMSLAGLVTKQQIEAKSVALVCNGEIVPRAHWKERVCEDADEIELFSVVAGG